MSFESVRAQTGIGFICNVLPSFSESVEVKPAPTHFVFFCGFFNQQGQVKQDLPPFFSRDFPGKLRESGPQLGGRRRPHLCASAGCALESAL